MILSAHIGLSYGCNLHCKHCFVDKKDDSDAHIKRLKEILPFIVEKGLFYIYYTYGEPLLCKEFYEFVEFMNRYDVYQVLMTNGTVIDENEARKINTSSLKKCMISIDSIYPEKHDLNRRKKGSWDQAINGIRLIKNMAERVTLGIATTVTQQNQNELLEILKFAEEEEVDDISFLAERKNGRLLSPIDNLQYKNIFIESVMKRDRKIRVHFHDYTLIKELSSLNEKGLISNGRLEKNIAMNNCHCSTNISISPAGYVFMCNFMNSEPLGNIHEDGIEKILTNHCKSKKICSIR